MYITISYEFYRMTYRKLAENETNPYFVSQLFCQMNVVWNEICQNYKCLQNYYFLTGHNY